MENLSAYAVYQKKVKGVGSYEDPEALEDGNAGRYVRAKAASKKKGQNAKAPKPEKAVQGTRQIVNLPNGSLDGNASSPDEGEKLASVLMNSLSKKKKKKNKKKQKAGNVTNGHNGSFNQGNFQLSESSPEASHGTNVLAAALIDAIAAARTPTKKANQSAHQRIPASSSDSSPDPEVHRRGPVPPQKRLGPVPLTSNVQASKTPKKQEVQSQNIEKPKQKKKLSLVEPPVSVPVHDSPSEKKRKRNSEVPRHVLANDNQPQKKAKTQQPASAAANETPILTLLNNHPPDSDSTQLGKQVFEWLIAPTKLDTFMSKYWEQKPLLVKRGKNDYYKWLHSSEELDHILRDNVVRFGKNIDITAYENGVRETIEIEGRALPPTVWSYYGGGCSVRFLNPQSYVENIRKLNSMLQEYFGTFVGSNSYLTPPDSQGFAPHYDDIEAFIIQLEGKKHWKVYKPRDDSEVLPRFSSRNFSEETDDLGDPIIDIVLEEGDLLYLPRGYIHQAKAVDVHSYHLTLSCYQLNSWGDLLKEYLTTSIDEMMKTDSQFRQGLPLDYLQYMGKAQQSNGAVTKEKKRLRNEFHQKGKELVSKMLQSITFDHAADRMGKKFIWDSLPPVFTADEKEKSSVHDGEHMKNGEIVGKVEFNQDIEVRLARRYCTRLVHEDGNVRVYFNLENSLEYHGEEVVFVEIPKETENVMVALTNAYPAYVKISQLPLGDSDTTIQVISDLWDRRILVTKEKLPDQVDSDDSDEDDMEVGDIEQDSEDEEESEQDSSD